MTERALYLVLISGRENSEDRDAEYWLSLVRSFAGDAPVIVLLHKSDEDSVELGQKLLREKYGKGLVFIETDSKTGRGIEELRTHICTLAGKLTGLRAAWPAEWWSIKDELPAQRKSWLTFDDFRTFCADKGVREAKDQEALAESLHDLGMMLSYRKDETLRDFGVLNPQWVTKGIYAMLNSPALRDAAGKFTVDSFAEVLPTRAYPKHLHPYLLALMRKFKLCFPLDDKGRKHLIPELLPKEEPNLEADFPPETCLGFIYRYGAVLPEGLLPRFIVETYVHRDREPKHAWRTGVVLDRAESRALVRGDVQGRTITIRVADGTAGTRRELLGIIREHFDRIHRSYEKLPVTELVPIPGHPTVLVEHEELATYEHAGREKITVRVGKDLEDFAVKELLDGVDLPGMARTFQDLANGGFPDDLVISYAAADACFHDELRAALVPYERRWELTTWATQQVAAGLEWEAEVMRRIGSADIVVFLLSNDLIASDHFPKELAVVAERRRSGRCHVLPIMVRACAFEKEHHDGLEAIIPGGKPVKQHADHDQAWLEVTKKIDGALKRVRRKAGA